MTKSSTLTLFVQLVKHVPERIIADAVAGIGVRGEPFAPGFHGGVDKAVFAAISTVVGF